MKIWVVVSIRHDDVEAHGAFESKEAADAYRGKLFVDHMFDVLVRNFRVVECDMMKMVK